MTRSPSLGVAAARLNDCCLLASCSTFCIVSTYAITLFPRPAGTETEANQCGPRASLEEEDGEDDTEADTETGADEHRRKAAIPLR